MKPWYKSKTVVFNLVTVAAAMAAGAVGLLPTVQPMLTPEVFGWVTMAVGLVNVALRAVTTQAIGFKPDDA